MAMDLNAKAAYIRGMMKGMEFDPTTQEGKIIVAMMDLLEEMADVVSEHDDALDQAFDRQLHGGSGCPRRRAGAPCQPAPDLCAGERRLLPAHVGIHD